MEMVKLNDKLHTPVMLNEALEYLQLQPGKKIADATIGMGAHASEILKRIIPGGRLIGIDRDQESLSKAQENLAEYSGSFDLAYSNFIDLDAALAKLNIDKVDGILFDLGVSSFQLGSPERGFSFQADGPLDMRLDRNSFISAYDLVNNLNEEEISALLWNFGQERWHNRIARALVQERQKHPISTTTELSQLVIRAIPYKHRHYRIHPATRTFQAMRIAVNRELETLEASIKKAVDLLNPGGRICVIAFHSLEDRIIKLTFKQLAAKGMLDIITPKPLTPTLAETRDNPPSRSAKFRVGERL